MTGGTGFPYDSPELVSTLLHDFRMLLIHLKAGFNYHYRRMIFFPDVINIVDAMRYDHFLISLKTGIKCPIRIQRHSHDIPLCTIFCQCVQIAVIKGLMETVVQMHNDLGLWENRLYGIISG